MLSFILISGCKDTSFWLSLTLVQVGTLSLKTLWKDWSLHCMLKHSHCLQSSCGIQHSQTIKASNEVADVLCGALSAISEILLVTSNNILIKLVCCTKMEESASKWIAMWIASFP